MVRRLAVARVFVVIARSPSSDQFKIDAPSSLSLRAQRSNPAQAWHAAMDCFVALSRSSQ
jgi:hypothetical protein